MMTKKDMIKAAIEANGYCPQVDDESDVYVRYQMKSITASCEFFYTDMDSMKDCVGHALNILGVVRSTYLKTMSEINES